MSTRATRPTRWPWLVRLLGFLPLLGVTMATGSCSREPLGSDDAGPLCVFKGKTYAPGAHFPSDDGCNRCSCDTDGVARCTVKSCSDAAIKNCPDPITGELGPCPDAGPSTDAGPTCVDVGGSPIECPDGGNSDGPSPEVGRDGGPVCQDSSGTVIPCPEDGGSGTCAYLGKIYRPGDVFEAADGCNSCICAALTARVECTAQTCGDPGADGGTT